MSDFSSADDKKRKKDKKEKKEKKAAKKAAAAAASVAPQTLHEIFEDDLDDQVHSHPSNNTTASRRRTLDEDDDEEYEDSHNDNGASYSRTESKSQSSISFNNHNSSLNNTSSHPTSSINNTGGGGGGGSGGSGGDAPDDYDDELEADMEAQELDLEYHPPPPKTQQQVAVAGVALMLLGVLELFLFSYLSTAREVWSLVVSGSFLCLLSLIAFRSASDSSLLTAQIYQWSLRAYILIILLLSSLNIWILQSQSCIQPCISASPEIECITPRDAKQTCAHILVNTIAIATFGLFFPIWLICLPIYLGSGIHIENLQKQQQDKLGFQVAGPVIVTTAPQQQEAIAMGNGNGKASAYNKSAYLDEREEKKY